MCLCFLHSKFIKWARLKPLVLWYDFNSYKAKKIQVEGRLWADCSLSVIFYTRLQLNLRAENKVLGHMVERWFHLYRVFPVFFLQSKMCGLNIRLISDWW